MRVSDAGLYSGSRTRHADSNCKLPPRHRQHYKPRISYRRRAPPRTRREDSSGDWKTPGKRNEIVRAQRGVSSPKGEAAVPAEYALPVINPAQTIVNVDLKSTERINGSVYYIVQKSIDHPLFINGACLL